MLNLLFIALGGAIGSVARFLFASFGYFILGRSFPYGTLLVNVTGCLLAGIVSEILIQRYLGSSTALRSLLIVGFMGGYTTFSSFSLETLSLFENGQALLAGLNVLLSVVLCLVAVWLGTLLGRQL